MTMNNVSVLQTDGPTVHMSQRNMLAILSLQDLRAWMDIRTVLNQLHQELAITIIHSHRFGNILGDLQRHSELSNRQVRITRDHRTRTKIDALTHQIAADATVLRVQATHDTLQWTTRTLSHRSHALDLIVHDHRNGMLQNRSPALDHVHIRIRIHHLLAQHVIGLQNITVDMRQIVLRALLGVLLHRRANGGRCNGQNLANHPIGSRPRRTESHKRNVVVRNTLKYLQHDFRSQLHVYFFALASLLAINVFPRRIQSRHALQLDLIGLLTSATVFRGFAAPLHLGGELRNVIPSIGGRLGQNMTMLVLIDQEFAALETNTSANFHHVLDMLNQENRSGELNMTKISGSINIRHSIRGANRSGLQHTHARVKETTDDGLVVNIGITGGDLYHGIFTNLIGRHDTKLNPDDPGWIFVFVHLGTLSRY